MKTERRHELEENSLANWLGESVERIQPYSRTLLAGVLAVAAVLLAWGVYNQRSARIRRDGWNEYFAALNSMKTEQLSEVMSNYSGTEVATWAQLRLADMQAAEGVDLLFSNRPAALDELRSAETNYTEVGQASSDPLIQQRALIGLGRAYESLNRLDDARQQYEKLVADYPEGLFAESARGRIADLQRQSTREFYDWFATQNPQPASQTELGSPGQQPPFDFESLPDDPTSLFPGGSEPETDGPGGEGPALDLGGGAEAEASESGGATGDSAGDASDSNEGQPADAASEPTP